MAQPERLRRLDPISTPKDDTSSRFLKDLEVIGWMTCDLLFATCMRTRLTQKLAT